MKRHGNLYPQVVSFKNLLLAARKVFRGKKFKGNVTPFFFNLENEVIQLQKELTTGIYQPRDYQTFEVREPKVRQICSSNFRDRVVHHAICNLLEPIFEDRLIYHSYACRKGKGTHLALRQCQSYARKYEYFLKCDIKKYFQSIDHQILKNVLGRFIKDKELLKLIDLIIDHAVPGNEVKTKGI
jgi:RNA-directed DNA polymerase